MAKAKVDFQEWPYQFVDQDTRLKDWLELRGMSILRLEGSFRCALGRPVVRRTPGRVRDELTGILSDHLSGARFNLVHVERVETRGEEEIYYVSCYYAVSNGLLPQYPAEAREEANEPPIE